MWPSSKTFSDDAFLLAAAVGSRPDYYVCRPSVRPSFSLWKYAIIKEKKRVDDDPGERNRSVLVVVRLIHSCRTTTTNRYWKNTSYTHRRSCRDCRILLGYWKISKKQLGERMSSCRLHHHFCFLEATVAAAAAAAWASNNAFKCSKISAMKGTKMFVCLFIFILNFIQSIERCRTRSWSIQTPITYTLLCCCWMLLLCLIIINLAALRNTTHFSGLYLNRTTNITNNLYSDKHKYRIPFLHLKLRGNVEQGTSLFAPALARLFVVINRLGCGNEMKHVFFCVLYESVRLMMRTTVIHWSMRWTKIVHLLIRSKWWWYFYLAAMF